MARTRSGGTRADHARQQLRDDILTGRLAPGQRLKFPELIDRCGVSASVLREALARLTTEGLVQAQAHHGYMVTPLSHEDLEELTTARLEIESLVLRQSIRYGDVDWEASVVAAYHVLERTPMTEAADPRRVTEAWAAAHAQFHHALLAGCRNRRLLTMARTLRDETELYRRWSVSLGNEPDRDVEGEHTALLEAAVKRDVDPAAERLRAHIAHTAQLLISCATDERSIFEYDQ